MQQSEKEHVSLIAVIGDVHGNLRLALAGLETIEQEQERKIDQVFSVGDFESCLAAEDWQFVGGPQKYRHPEWTSMIREAWQAWHWPLAMIGGNHEPWNKLREFRSDTFGSHLSFTAAGPLSHRVDGLRAYGLSGIFHPDHLEFHPAGERIPAASRAKSWPDFLRLVTTCGQVSPRRLAYYKREELDVLLMLPVSPHILLLHDWPTQPPGIQTTDSVRPEQELVERLRPRYVFCGHHHRAKAFCMGATECRALSIVQEDELAFSGRIRPGWAWLGQWEPKIATLAEIGYWPPLSTA
jgi:hypothetical protein